MQTIQKILSLLKTLLGLNKQKLETITAQENIYESKSDPIEPKPIPLTNAEKIYKVAISYLGKDASSKDLATDEFGCAESVSNIIHEVFPDFSAGVLSTADLSVKLKQSKHFKQVLEPSEGAIIVSPRMAGIYGHCGIFMSEGGIASNNSNTGEFEVGYNWDTWIKTFGKNGRNLHTYIYEAI